MEMNPLFVPELLHSVLDYLSISPSEGPMTVAERRTLVALARTCSTLSEPSLDRLWRCLDSLLPLVRSFADVVDNNRVETLPSPQEWLIINRYSPRIRKLSLGADHLSLRFLQCTKLILPNLKVLGWERPLGSDRDISYIWPLLTSKIVTLEVELGSITDSGSQSFLENFTRLCPNSKSINFKFFSLGGLAPVSATKVLSQAICGRADWEHVKLSCAVDGVTLRHLRLLKEVSLTLALEPKGPEDMRFEHTETPFRNVTRLALTLWKRIDVATNLLRAHNQAFHSLK